MISKSTENASKLNSINLIVNNTATFNTSISAPALSGTFYGDGSRLSGVGGTYTPPANATFTSSVSAPALSGTFFGDGRNLNNLDAGDIVFGTLSAARLPAVATFTTSVSAPALSGAFFGDGSRLTGVGGTYTPPANATFTSSVSAPALSGTFYGDGSRLTGIATNVTASVATEVIISTPGQTVFDLSTTTYAPSTNNITVYFNGLRLLAGRDYSETDSNTITLAQSVATGSYFLFEVGKLVARTNALSGTVATFSTSISAPALSGAFFGDGSRLTGVGGTYTPPANATFSSSVSAPALSGAFYGDGRNLHNLDAGDIVFGTLSAARLPAVATFSTSISAPALSGAFFGDGSRLSGVGGTYTPPANATFTSSVSAPALSGAFFGDGSRLSGVGGTYTPPANATFTSSVSAPALSGTFYGDGSKLTGIAGVNTTISINAPSGGVNGDIWYQY